MWRCIPSSLAPFQRCLRFPNPAACASSSVLPLSLWRAELGLLFNCAWPELGVPLRSTPRRLLQLERCATGLDGGVVYGNTLYCLLLPPLGPDGQPRLDQAGAPPDAQQIRLCSGLPAFIVGVPARQAYAPTG